MKIGRSIDFLSPKNLGILRDSETRKKEIKLRGELEAAAIADEIRLVLKPIFMSKILRAIFEHRKDILPSQTTCWSAMRTMITAILVKYLAKGSNKIFICIQQATCVA